jgi:hypothetical protein
LRQGDGERVGVNAECAGVAVGLGEAEPVGVGAGDVGDGLLAWAGVGDPDGVPDGDVGGVGDVGAGLGDRVGVCDLAGAGWRDGPGLLGAVCPRAGPRMLGDGTG